VAYLPVLSITVLLGAALMCAFALLHRIDRGLEAGMLIDPRPSLRERVRAWLGLDTLHDHLHRLETLMATATEQLAALSTKVDDLIADVRAALAVINQDDLSDTAQAELDRLSAKVAAFDTEVGDADGSDTPPVEDNPTL